MARGFAYLEVNQSTRSLQGTTRTSGLNFLGNRCWTECVLRANGAQKTKNGDLRRQTPSRLAYELPRSLAAKSISARDPALGDPQSSRLSSRARRLRRKSRLLLGECVHLPAFTPPTPHAPRPEGVLTLAAVWYFNAGQVSVPAGGKSRVPLTPEAFVPVVLKATFARQVGCCRWSPSGATLLSSPGRHLPQQRGWRLGARGGLSASGCCKVPLPRPPL